MSSRRAVYSTLIGGYEQIQEQPVAVESDIPFFCFTDDDQMTSDTWHIVRVDPEFPLDPVRSQRMLKIRGHDALSPFDETLYIDNSVRLLRKPEDLLDEWLEQSDFALPQHSFRDQVIDEFDEVVAANLDDAARVNEQLLHYSELYSGVLQSRPYWTALLARKNVPHVQQAMDLWADHVLRFSRRDQLSLNVVLSISGLSTSPVLIDNYQSEWHRWPMDLKRRVEQGKFTTKNSGPLLAEVGRLKRSVVAAERALHEARDTEAELRQLLLTRESELALSHENLQGLRQEIDALRSSTSWRLSAPLRAVVGAGKNLFSHTNS